MHARCDVMWTGLHTVATAIHSNVLLVKAHFGTDAGKLSSALLDTHGQSFRQRSRSGSMQTYMEGLPESVAALTDTILKVDGTDLPVHRAILAVNSPVFADLFAYALSRGSRSSRPSSWR